MTDMATTKSFADRMKERIRESIGELITDDDLLKMVERGIDEVFFDERTVRDGYRFRTVPPLIHSAVRESLDARMDVAVENWVRSHEDEVMHAVHQAVQQGAGEAILQAFRNHFAQALREMGMNIENNFRSTR